MILKSILVLLGLFHAANGLFMLADPDAWYAAVPGVTHSGPINHHFIRDIGLAFLASGIGLALGARRGARAGAFALAGATFPTVHAVMHVVEWCTHGFPPETAWAFSDAIAVAGASFLGAAAALVRFRQGDP